MDQTLERRFLTHVLKDTNSSLAASQRGVMPDFFQWKTAGTLYKVASWYVQTYNSVLTSAELSDVLKQSSTIPEDLQKSVSVLFDELQLEGIDSNIDFLIDEMFQYDKQNLVEHALRTSVEVLSEKKVDKAISILKTNIQKIESKFRIEEARSGPLNIDVVPLVSEFHDRMAHPEKYVGVKFGFSAVDAITGGLQKATTSLIVGPYKSFKSALALNIAINVAKTGKQVLVHCNEGSRKFWHQRLAAKELQIPLGHITNGTMSQDEQTRWLTYYQEIQDGKHPFLSNIYFDEVPLSLSTPGRINETIKERQQEVGQPIDLVLVDYFGRLSPNNKGNMAKWEQLGVVADELADVAIQNRVAIVSTAHPNLEAIKNAKKEGEDIDPESMGLSSQPIKSVDYFFSWIIENMEEFERNGHKGFARLALKLSRHSMTGSSTLMVEGRFMDIKEIQMSGNSGIGTSI